MWEMRHNTRLCLEISNDPNKFGDLGVSGVRKEFGAKFTSQFSRCIGLKSSKSVTLVLLLLFYFEKNLLLTYRFLFVKVV
jgi:hypothetical protein